METHALKGKLMLTRNGKPVFTAQESKVVPGAVDVIRIEGLIEHPSPKQALSIAKKLGVSEADFRTSFGHMMPGKSSSR
jgi:hypothetical protein